jgi:hypothetical protein
VIRLSRRGHRAVTLEGNEVNETTMRDYGQGKSK